MNSNSDILKMMSSKVNQSRQTAQKRLQNSNFNQQICVQMQNEHLSQFKSNKSSTLNSNKKIRGGNIKPKSRRSRKPKIDVEEFKKQNELKRIDIDKLISNFKHPSNGIASASASRKFINKSIGVDTSEMNGVLHDISIISQGYVDCCESDTNSIVTQYPTPLAQNILGDMSELSNEANIIVSRASLASAQAQAVATNQAVTAKVETVTEACTSALAKGIAKFNSLNAAVGGLNGARDLLEASLQDALDRQIAKLMSMIVGAINVAHGYTHPLFLTIFEMTWDQNLQWVPDHIKADLSEKYNDPGDGSCIPKWMEPLKVIPEYFDFIQKIFGGAIADIWDTYEDLILSGYAACEDWAAGLDLSVSVSIPAPPLSVPLMSISKQMEDVLNKIYVIKEMIRLKAKMILKKLKSLEAPELYINMPAEFELILWTLVEAEVIMNNLPIVLDKILEYFMNLLVEEFCKYADQIISKIFEIWQKVIEIVPPLQDLVELAWAIPNQADFCCNVALNIALPEIYAIVQPYIDMPFQCIQMVSDACDMAADMIYAIPPP